MRSFAPILRKFRGLFTGYLVLGIAATLASAFSVRLLQGLLDSFTAGALVLPAIGLYGGLLILLCAANYAQVYPEQRLTHGIYLELKVEALRKMRTIDYAAYQRLGTGSLVQRIENGAAAGRGMLFDYWLRLLSELVPSVVVSLTFIALMDWKVMALIGVGYVVVFVVTRLLLRILYRIKERILTGEEAFSQLLVRGFMELVVFRLNRRFGREIQRAEQAADAICANKTRMRMVHESFFTIFALRLFHPVVVCRRGRGRHGLCGQRLHAHCHFQRPLCAVQARPGGLCPLPGSAGRPRHTPPLPGTDRPPDCREPAGKPAPVVQRRRDGGHSGKRCGHSCGSWHHGDSGCL